MYNTQNQTEDQKNLVIEFYEKFQSLIKNAPDGAQYFAMIKAPEGANTGATVESQITACEVTGNTLINLFANTFREAPQVKKSVRLALTVSEMADSPLEALMAMVHRGKPNISDIFK